MSKKRKSHRLDRGPWTGSHIAKELQRVGYCPAQHGRHLNFEHPSRPGKVQVDTQKWTGVKVGSLVFRGLMVQTGYTKQQLQRVLNGLDAGK